MSTKEITGAEILLECLKKEKVDTLFCYPGGVVLKIFDVLYEQKDIRMILPRHEQGGVLGGDHLPGIGIDPEGNGRNPEQGRNRKT